jgi:hypothetical protein
MRKARIYNIGSSNEKVLRNSIQTHAIKSKSTESVTTMLAFVEETEVCAVWKSDVK